MDCFEIIARKSVTLGKETGNRIIGRGLVASHTLPLHYGKRLIGSEGGSSRPAQDIPRILRLLQAGRFSAATMVTDRVALPEINEAIANMRQGLPIHILVRP
jgi:Zn-dependent alcohol dehydrogenase